MTATKLLDRWIKKKALKKRQTIICAITGGLAGTEIVGIYEGRRHQKRRDGGALLVNTSLSGRIGGIREIEERQIVRLGRVKRSDLKMIADNLRAALPVIEGNVKKSPRKDGAARATELFWALESVQLSLPYAVRTSVHCTPEANPEAR